MKVEAGMDSQREHTYAWGKVHWILRSRRRPLKVFTPLAWVDLFEDQRPREFQGFHSEPEGTCVTSTSCLGQESRDPVCLGSVVPLPTHHPPLP